MKQRSNLSAIGQQLGETTQSYIVAPLISAPNSNIRTLSGATRQIPDPSKTLKPAMGIERVMIKTIAQRQDEVGSNGENVWETDSKDARIRLVGNRWAQDSAADNNGTKAQSNNVGDYVEVTFYGTGLNFLTHLNATSNTLQASVDGGAATTVLSGSYSAVLNNRNYLHNAVINAASGLALGTHTVRITLTAGTFFIISGVEILNTSSVTNIVAPKGAVIANGNKYNIGTDQAFAYATGFDGNPSLNGRGGKVVVYATPEGRVGKVIQQVDSSSLTNTSTNHTNEELIRKVNWREFGANRADDFSTLGTARAAAFTTDDGTSTLVGDSVVGQTINNIDSFFLNGTGNFFTITFVGTGLDLFQTQSSVARDLTLTIDGVSAGTIAAAQLLDRRVVKVVSGLPYGTHTVRFTQSAGGTEPTFSDFYIYGPKTPTIPDNAVKIAEYNLMATYSASSIQSTLSTSPGVLRKSNLREFTYVGTWSVGAADASYAHGFNFSSNVSTSYFEYTFYGTGAEVIWYHANAASINFTTSINGSSNLSGFTTSLVQAGTGLGFVASTGVVSGTTNASGYGNRLRISGLTLGLHRIRVTVNINNSHFFDGLDIITPINISANKVGSMSIADVDLINKSTDKPALDLSKAKAWIVLDGTNQRIINSFNISAALRQGTGEYRVYLEKPFKSNNYVQLVSTNTNQVTIGGAAIEKTPGSFYFFTTNSSGTLVDGTLICIACFGELFDE